MWKCVEIHELGKKREKGERKKWEKHNNAKVGSKTVPKQEVKHRQNRK